MLICNELLQQKEHIGKQKLTTVVKAYNLLPGHILTILADSTLKLLATNMKNPQPVVLCAAVPVYDGYPQAARGSCPSNGQG